MFVTRSEQKSSGFANFLGAFKGGNNSDLLAQKARLEAFLAAVPMEYCGWTPGGILAYSPGFCRILGIERVQCLGDIQHRLAPGDSAALEGMWGRLEADGTPFILNVRDYTEKKVFKLSGVRSRASAEGDEPYNILWMEDITLQSYASDMFAEEQMLQRQEAERLQDSLDCLPFPVWIRDGAQKIMWCNVAYAKQVGARPSEIIAQQKELITSSRKRKVGDKDAPDGAALAALAAEKGFPQETSVHAVVGGNRLLLKISEIPLRKLGLTVGIAEDRTIAEELEGRIQKNQSANMGLLEQLRAAIAIYGEDQKLEFYNSAFAQMWGLEDGWLNTKPRLGEVMEKLRETRRLPEQADFRKFKKSWLDMFTGLIDPYEDMLYLPDGTAVRMLVVPHTIGGLMMNFEDVTSRLALESSYNTLIAVQKETLDNLAEGVAVFGGDGRLKLWNPAFARMWGLNPEDLDGEPHISKIVEKVKGSFAEDEWPNMRDKLIGLALDRTMHEGRLVRIDKVEIDYATVPLPDGGVLTTYTDVSDSVRVENALRDKNAALEAAERLKLDFLANVSYQLRTPLNAIMGFNEILEQQYFGPLNDRQKDYTADIKAASGKLLGLINDILDLSSFEAGYMALERGPVQVKDMLSNLVALASEWARKQDIEIKLSCPANIGKVSMDEARMKQALMNLVRNAIAHTPEKGQITVQARRMKDALVLSVEDNGSGISQDDQQRILQPFERGDGGDERGAGLGLSLVQNIASLHGGTFNLESAPGRGTSAAIFLPLKTV
ncbi:MAG: PAS-domain containing protein [Alphaproteobacteria bacterium]|nr:PAS-domain containing protein [Alphaproteobacteria bacterium]